MDRMEEAMSHVVGLEPDQLRAVLAHVAGLHAHAEGTPSTLDMMRRVIDRLECQQADERMSAIAWRVAFKHGLTLAELKTKAKSFDISHPRQEAMFLMREIKGANGLPRYSYPRIAMFFGLLDHTTALHGVRAHRGRILRQQAKERVAA